jgi:hypothetical protein
MTEARRRWRRRRPVLDHPATRWTRAVLGVVCVGIALYLVVDTRAHADRLQWIGQGVLFAVGVVLLPGAAAPLWQAVRQVLTLWRGRGPRSGP